LVGSPLVLDHSGPLKVPKWATEIAKWFNNN
jgi:hypothetical protein